MKPIFCDVTWSLHPQSLLSHPENQFPLQKRRLSPGPASHPELKPLEALGKTDSLPGWSPPSLGRVLQPRWGDRPGLVFRWVMVIVVVVWSEPACLATSRDQPDVRTVCYPSILLLWAEHRQWKRSFPFFLFLLLIILDNKQKHSGVYTLASSQ